MNKIFKVIYNKSTQAFQAVSELGKSHNSTGGVGASKAEFASKAITWSIAALLSLASITATAAPTDGQVVAGDAIIHQAGLITNIQQSSQNAAINWQQFDIKPSETVNFHQPNAQAITLNRVLGNEKSVIDGAMNANGQVFIQNPNGTLIGKDAQINVGGLLATTAHISNDDFMQGNYRFDGKTAGGGRHHQSG